MKIKSTRIKDVKIIIPTICKDNRGYFTESYNKFFFNKNFKNISFIQDNESKSKFGTLRGLHFQKAPFSQFK